MTAETTPSGALRLILGAHDRQLLDVECDEVQVPGSEGVLGILPGHTPLIAALKVGEVMIRQGRNERYLALAEGFVEVADEVVTILTDSAEHPEEIDVEAARREAREAEEELMAAVNAGWVDAQAKLERANTRIQVAERARFGAGGVKPRKQRARPSGPRMA